MREDGECRGEGREDWKCGGGGGEYCRRREVNFEVEKGGKLLNDGK